ncbi:ADP-ribose glycohydrolase MACROD1 isoform X6 [Gasterosteus aculeatus]|uniref:ADP-ribose glycohydrolase MACROD1 isoform X4 n=1 Tax=Gasterosteus aculeatus aculeatus TaxID=481459 RepID=UPI001A99B9A5|nr:ADP-ribose glycohydrolase MACROD1 isoform X4 [Gasterosteus aculeatus aculeatus]
MALRMSSLFSHVRAALSRVRADRCDRFKHGLTPGSLQLGARPATGPVRGHVKAALRAERSSPGDGGPPALSPGRRGWPGRVAFGAAAVLGASTVALVRSLHAGKVTATARKVDLNSADGDWRKTKEYLLSLSVMDRRQHYRTSDFVPLKDVSLWTPPAGASEQTLYPRNEKLDQKISLYSGDITKLEVDAIVNAANKTLLGGGGDVIHTVGPVARGGVGQEEKNALRSCYEKSLTAATEGAARSVAFPCISTGVYGYPAEQAVHEALAAVREYLGEHHGELDRVIFCVFLPADKELYLQTLPLYFPAAAATVKSKL